MIVSLPGRQRGFTLIELLVVMALIGILAVVGLANYNTSLMRGRDAKRKQDIKSVSQALELYWADYETYPASDGNGSIAPCDVSATCSTISWGGAASLSDPNHGATLYMKNIPSDPSVGQQYYYQVSTDGKAYKLWARLEISTDPQAMGNVSSCAGYTGEPSCGTNGNCNFARTSSNVSMCSDGGMTFQ